MCKIIRTILFIMPLFFCACDSASPVEPESIIDEESLPWQSAELSQALIGEWYRGLNKHMLVTTANVTILGDSSKIFLIDSVESRTSNDYRLILADHPTIPLYFMLYLRIITETMLEVRWGRSFVFSLEDIFDIGRDEPYRITSYPYWERHRPPEEPIN